MSDSNNTFGKDKSDIDMISENDGIFNNAKQKTEKKYYIRKKYLK